MSLYQASTATFSRGVRVTYTGTTCPMLRGLTGWVTSEGRDGFVRVQFDGHPGPTKCCPFNLTRTSKRRV